MAGNGGEPGGNPKIPLSVDIEFGACLNRVLVKYDFCRYGPSSPRYWQYARKRAVKKGGRTGTTRAAFLRLRSLDGPGHDKAWLRCVAVAPAPLPFLPSDDVNCLQTPMDGREELSAAVLLQVAHEMAVARQPISFDPALLVVFPAPSHNDHHSRSNRSNADTDTAASLDKAVRACTNCVRAKARCSPSVHTGGKCERY